MFPTRKYQQVHDQLRASGTVDGSDILEPGIASWEELALVHTAEYLETMRQGTMSDEAIAELELPWSRDMVDGFRLMVGGTIEAGCLACGVKRGREGFSVLNDAKSLPDPIVCHIGGGLHHAFANHGEGFCPFNDVAVAVRVLQLRGLARVAIVDLDVHQGNGTAFIFNPRGAPRLRSLEEPASYGVARRSAGGAKAAPPRDEDRRLERRLSASGDLDASVFTFSMHQQHNYPSWKPRGSLDIGLPDGAADATFLGELERALPTVMASRPQCVFYLAGADPYEDDQLGGLRLTRDGLRQRDRLVIETVRAAAVPLVVTLAGGYARRIEDTVAIHVATIEEASKANTKQMQPRRHEGHEEKV